MAPSAPVSPVREILEGHLSHLLRELEGALEAQVSRDVAAGLEERVERIAAQAGERARGEFADRLNQAVRRIRQASEPAQIGLTLVDAAGALAAGAALLSVSPSIARGEAIRGVSPSQAESFRQLEIPLTAAAAFQQAVESRDPVTAMTAPAEISPQLASLIGHSPDERAFIYPVVTGERVPAVLYAWGVVQGSALELLTQLAAAVWTAAAASGPLVSILPASAGSSAWDALSPEEQRIHLRAQRFARVQVAEMRLFETEAVHSGRSRRDLYGALRARMDAARESFRETFFSACPTMVDYLHVELLRTLAHDDPELLGKDYPGPLV